MKSSSSFLIPHLHTNNHINLVNMPYYDDNSSCWCKYKIWQSHPN
jgi:hypothetical protein